MSYTPALEILNGVDADVITYESVSAADRAETRASWNRWDVLASAGVLTLIAIAYVYFNG